MAKTKKTVSLFFVALFMSYYASTAFFPHWHIIDGATITHSHLHTDSHHDTKNGDHTQQCITLITLLSHFEHIDFSCNYILKPVQFSLYECKFIEITYWVASIHLNNLSLRAPPIV